MQVLPSLPPVRAGAGAQRPWPTEPRGGRRHRQHGFTLIELMITVAIIAVLAAIALPAYQQYVRKAAYSELLSQMAPFKTAITECMAVQAEIAKCNSAELLGLSLPAPTAAMASLSINASDLTIKVMPKPYRGIDPNDYCELQPLIRRRSTGLSAVIEGWGYSATAPCVQRGYATS